MHALKSGDLLVSLTGNVGRVALLKEEFLPASLNQRVACLRIKNENVINKSFLFNYLNSDFFEQKCINASNGVAQKNMSTEWLKNYDIPTFLISKQKYISNILDKVNSLISFRKQQLSKLDELIKSRFIEMFMDQNCKDKYPLKLWKNVVTIKHGKDYKKNIAQIGGYPVYGSGGFMNVYADKYLVEENATIIGRKGTIDRPLFVNEKFWNVDTAFAIVVNKEILNPVFFYIRSTMYDLKSMSTSTTLPSMTKDILEKIEIGIPPISLQNEFAEFVKLIDKSKFKIQKSLEMLEMLKKSQLQKYFG